MKKFCLFNVLLMVAFMASCGSKICSISGCGEEIYADGLCSDHYTAAAEYDENNSSKEAGEVSEESIESDISQNGEGFIFKETDLLSDAYYIGDKVSMSQSSSSSDEIGYYDIMMTDWGTYVDQFINDTYIYVTFEVINTGDIDISISAFNFRAYVNNYDVDISGGDNNLAATLSPGRQTSGNVYIDMDPNDVGNLELELGDIIFRIQDNSYQDYDSYYGEADLSSFSYNDLYLFSGFYEGNADTAISVSIYSSFDEGNTVGNICLYDSLNHEVFATLIDNKEGEGVYTLQFDDLRNLYIRFYYASDGYYADIQGLDSIYTNSNEVESYIMTEQYIP